MFNLIKKILILLLISTANSLRFISLKNQECKVREVIVDNKYMTYPYSINNIINPYSRVCVPNITKKFTLKIFDLMILTNKTTQIIFHESCECICRLDPIICNNKQKWNKDKCSCDSLINKKCGNKFWNPNTCKCEYRAAYLLKKECEEIIDNKTLLINEHNKSVSIKESNSVD